MNKYYKLWFNKLNEQIINDTKMYKNINIKDKLKLYQSKNHLIVIIKNRKIIKFKYTNIVKIEKIINKRVISIKQLIELMLKKYNIEGEFIFRITDGYDYEYNYPIFCYSKPENKLGFLFPDFNFIKIINKKKIFLSICKKDKTNELYFKGTPTSIKNTKIREKMKNFIYPFNIVVNNNYESLYNICKYKYVLDLPGRKPWSVRLIELYSSTSFPIRILLYYSKWNENIWIQFYDKMFLNGQSYIGIKYNLNYDKQISDKIINNIKNKLLLIYNFINKNPKIYDKITKTNTEKIKALQIEHVIYYVYNVMKSYKQITKQ